MESMLSRTAIKSNLISILVLLPTYSTVLKLFFDPRNLGHIAIKLNNIKIIRIEITIILEKIFLVSSQTVNNPEVVDNRVDKQEQVDIVSMLRQEKVLEGYDEGDEMRDNAHPREIERKLVDSFAENLDHFVLQFFPVFHFLGFVKIQVVYDFWNEAGAVEGEDP